MCRATGSKLRGKGLREKPRARSSRPRWQTHAPATWLLTTALVVSMSTGCGRAADEAKSGAGASSISVTQLGDAPPLRLGLAADTPTVVNVWATWCGPCRKEMPAFNATAERYRGRVRFAGVNLGEERATAERFIDEIGVTFDQYLDPDSTVNGAFSITTMPATVFVRADGTVATTHNGALDESELESLLESELGVARPAQGGS